MFKRASIATLLALSGVASQATTVNVVADGSWFIFDVDQFSTGNLAWADIAYEGNFSPLSFSVVIPSGQTGVLTVVDAGFSGETYTVSLDGMALSPMSVPGAGGDVGIDFDAALASNAFSQGTYQLDAGTHTISGLMVAGVGFDASSGGLSVSVVPEPATALSLLVGLGLLAATSRRAPKRE